MNKASSANEREHDREEDTPSSGMNLTQGCSIEWDDQETETPGKSVNLTTLFQSPTPRSHRSVQSSGMKVPGSDISSTASISPNLATQPPKSRENKDQRVEDEVDYIYSMLENDSKAAVVAKQKEKTENSSQAEAEASTPRVHNANAGKSQRISTNEFTAMLSGLNGRGSSSSGAQIAGANDRRKRREMIERKRLFRQATSSKRDGKKRRGDINMQKKQTQSVKSSQGVQGSSSSSNLSSFDDLLMELNESSTLRTGSPGSGDEDSDSSIEHDESDCVQADLPSDCVQADLPREMSNPLNSKDAAREVINRNDNSERRQVSESQPNVLEPEKEKCAAVDQFDDFNFDDDIFAAVDAAVLERQTQTQVPRIVTPSDGLQGRESNHSAAPSCALQRSQTLPTSNKSCDMIRRHDSLGDNNNETTKQNTHVNQPLHVTSVQGMSLVLSDHTDQDKSLAVKTTASAGNLHASSSADQKCVIEDDYGDFPMLDFDAIDELVAQRGTAKENASPGAEFVSCTRYRICSVNEDANSFTKRLGVALWRLGNPESRKDNTEAVVDAIIGFVHLHGEWFHTNCEVGDVIHLCSLSGRYNTYPSSLPLALHTTGVDDDIVMILHPDALITPTTISETVSCLRRAILKTRYGSSGLIGK